MSRPDSGVEVGLTVSFDGLTIGRLRRFLTATKFAGIPETAVVERQFDPRDEDPVPRVLGLEVHAIIESAGGEAEDDVVSRR